MRKIKLFFSLFALALSGTAAFVLTQYWPAIKPIFTNTPLNLNAIVIAPVPQPQTPSPSPQPTPAPGKPQLTIFAADLGPARMLAWAPDGTLLVSVTKQGKVLALPDRNNDGKADNTIQIIGGLRNPHGLAVDGNTVYIAEEHRVIRLDNLTADFTYDGPKVILTGIPSGDGHFTRSLAIGPDRKLYISVGSSCNVCNESNPWRAAVLQTDLDGTHARVFASGLRNSVGIFFKPGTSELWGTDNGRDWLGDNLPPEEINRINEGGNYGWPICYGQKIHDTDFDKNVYIRDPCADSTAPQVELPAHIAPLGLRFYEGAMFKEFAGNIFVAEHGSWNSTTPVGYQVVRIWFDEQQQPHVEPFISQWLQPNGSTSGRPVDIIFGTLGEMFISDDKAGVIYRVAK